MKKFTLWLIAGIFSVALVACGEKTEETSTEAASEVTEDATPAADGTPDITEEKLAYYADNPDFFTFATIEDLPDDLVWENGAGVPDIGDPNAKKGGTYHERLTDFPRTLRHSGPDSNGSFRPFILDFVQIPFVDQHPDTLEFIPGLATEWAVSMERRTGYVRINPDARWSDGEPITADDMMFRFFYSRSPYIKAPWLNDYYSNFFTNITKYDDYTFSITIPEAKPDIVSRTVNLSPAPEHFYKELGEDFVERYQWRFVPTTGPYVIHEKDLKKGRSIALTRNDDWWMKDKKFYRNRFNFDKIRFNVIRDVAKGFEAFKSSELSRFRITDAEFWYDKLPDTDPDVQNGYIHKSTFYNTHPRPTYGLWMNSSKPFLDNNDIRKGISHATNFELVIEKYFRGDFARMRTTADGFGEFTHPTMKARPYDIEKALEYFAKAGFTTRNADGILVNSAGQKLSFTLSSGYERYKDVFTILREEALKAGLELRVEVLDGTAGWKKVQEKKHDIHFVAFGVGLQMYPRYWETYHSDNAYDVAFSEDGSANPERKVKTQTNNFQIIADPRLDAMIDSYRHNEDKEDMKRLAFEMEEILYEHASFVPGWVTPFYRTGHWRWLRYPEGTFDTKHSQYDWQHFVHWIDTDIQAETEAAMKAGETFPPEVNIYDQHKEQ